LTTPRSHTWGRGEQTRELRTISRQIDAEQWNRFWRENRGRKLQSFGYGWMEVK
jgi:hypothetical protein